MILATNSGVRTREFSLRELYDYITEMLEDGYEWDEMWLDADVWATLKGDD